MLSRGWVAFATVLVAGSGATSAAMAGPAVGASLPSATSASNGLLYVMETDGGLLPIDLATNSTRFPIADAFGNGIAISPDGKTAFTPDDFLGVVNTALLPRGPAGQTIFTTALQDTETPPHAANGIAITPDGSTAYVAGQFAGTVIPVNLASYSALKPIKVGGCPIGMAITPNGKTAYVANDATNTVTPIATATNTPGIPIQVGAGPQAIAVTPDGKTIYVANSFSDTVTPIATATNQPGAPIPVGAAPLGLAITPDGQTVYVANYHDDSVTPISTATNSAGAPIPVGGPAFGIAVSPDGTTAYVTTTDFQPQARTPCRDASTPSQQFEADTVVPIATASNTAGPAIYTATLNGLPSEGSLGRLVVAPDQAPIAKLSVTPEPAGAAAPTRFDASKSVAPSSPIVSYHWDFGDGQTAITAGPSTTHSYTAANTYRATLTETDAAGTSTTQVFTGQTMSRNGGPSAAATANVVIVSCTKTHTCAGSVSVPSTATAPGATVAFVGNPTAAVGTVHLSVAPASVVCPAEDPSVAPVAQLTDTGFNPASRITITTQLHNTLRASTHQVCFSSTVPFRSQANPTTAKAGTALLLNCTATGNVAPCVISTQQVGPDVVVQFAAPGGDPTFRIVAPTPLGTRIPTIPRCTYQHSYTAVFQTKGGIGHVQWKILSGKLPPGMTLNPTGGTITGKATAKGQYIFTIQASDTESPPENAKLVASITVS